VLGAKHLPAPLADEHQMGVKEINDVPALAYFHELDQYLKGDSWEITRGSNCQNAR
jgi:hypothetical protein